MCFMKHPILITILLFLVILGGLSSCNNDVFIDKIKATSATDLQMSGEGDSASVTINSSKWSVAAITATGQPEYFFSGKVYEADGTLIGDNYSFAELMPPKVTLVYENAKNGFTVKHTADQRLDISVAENLSDQNFLFTVWVSDGYTYIPINVVQSPSAGYAIDHIDYTLIPKSYTKAWEGTRDSLEIQSDTPVTMQWSIFSSEKQVISFKSKEAKAFAYTKEDDQVEIPNGVVDGRLRFAPDKMYYRASEQKGNLPFADVSKSVVFPMGKSAIERVIEYESFDASYTLYLRHKQSGALKSVSGIFHSKMPTGENYYLIVNNRIQK
jgi:hypothetical protein